MLDIRACQVVVGSVFRGLTLVAEVRRAIAGSRTTRCVNFGESSGIFEPVPATE